MWALAFPSLGFWKIMVSDNCGFWWKLVLGKHLRFFSLYCLWGFFINISAKKYGQENLMTCLELFLVVVLIWISGLGFKFMPTLLFPVIRIKTICCRWNATSRCNVTTDKRQFSKILLMSISINTFSRTDCDNMVPV